MKNSKLPLITLSLVLFFASCKKEDTKQSAESTATATALSAADTTGWASISQWQKADQGTFSIHYFTIQDSSITSDVADNGLVLVFKKNGSNINSLPFEETANASTTTQETNPNYWYHQVSEGSLLISYDVYKAAATADVANTFKYFVLTPEKLQTLQSSGYTTEKLMNLGYAEVANLLKQTN